MVITVRQLVRSAPNDIGLPAEALDQTVGWLPHAQRPASLREFIASQAPRPVMASLDVNPSEAPIEPVKRVTELTDGELRQVVVSILKEAPPDSVLAIIGEGTYNQEELVHQVESGTPLGQELTKAIERHIELLEGLIDAGKIKGLSSRQSSSNAGIVLQF